MDKQWIKRSLVLAMTLAVAGTPGVFANTALKDAEAQKAKLENSINAQESKIDGAKARVDETAREMEALDRQVNIATAELNQVNDDILRLQKEIEEVQRELDEAKAKLAQNQEAFGERMKVMYTKGSAGYLEILFNAKDVETLLTNTDRLKAIAKQDRDLIDFMKEQVRIIREKEAELKEKQGQLEARRGQVEAKRNALAQASAAKAAFMQTLVGDLAQFEREYDDMLRTSDEIESKIKGIKQEIAAEEARKREAEAAAQKAKAKGTGGKTGSSPVRELPLGGSPTIRSNKSLLWPVPGHMRVSSPFGYRIHPILGYSKFHSGVDIPAPSGTPTVAAKAGTVITSTFMGGYGNVVMIDHGDCVTVYAHNSALKVSVGQKVQAGDTVALIGSTGLSTGPHLHFEVRINGAVVNPLGYI